MPMLDPLASHPRRDDLAELVEAVARASARPNSADVARLEAEKRALRSEDAETPVGNVIELLERGAESDDERALLASLLARGLALSSSNGKHDEDALRAPLLWLATQGRGLDRPRAGASPKSIAGELAPAPRHPLTLILLGVTGLLFVSGAARLFGKLVLAYRRPVELRLESEGLVLRTRTQMLGRVLREGETRIPFAGLSLATRDIRYPGLPLYLGIIALAVGSYVGMSLVTDGLRAASLSMVGAGALVVLAGLAIDFALSSLLPGRAGRCRMLLVPQRGPKLCIGAIDIEAADRLLGSIASR